MNINPRGIRSTVGSISPEEAKRRRIAKEAKRAADIETTRNEIAYIESELKRLRFDASNASYCSVLRGLLLGQRRRLLDLE